MAADEENADSSGELAVSIAAFTALYAVSAVPLAWLDEFTSYMAPPVPWRWLISTLVLASGLVLLSAIDLRDYRLPDMLTLPLAAAGVAAAWWIGDSPYEWHAASAFIAFGLLAGLALLYRRVRGRDGLGLGDAKLLAASGAWLGAQALPAVLLVACGAALVGLFVANWRPGGISGSTRIPFGPFLAFGTWALWLYGGA